MTSTEPCRIRPATLVRFGLLVHTLGWMALTPTVGAAEHLFILAGQSNMKRLSVEKYFTPVVAQAFGVNQVIVVKDARGGQPIRRWDRDWQPGPTDPSHRIGDLHGNLLAQVREAIEGKTIESVTLLWMQGETDARDQTGDRYEASLSNVLQQWREDLQVNDLNFVIGRLSGYGLGNPRYRDWEVIREIQQHLADSNDRGVWVDTDGLNATKEINGQTVQDIHYSAAGYATFGQRLAEAAIELIRIGTTISNLR